MTVLLKDALAPNLVQTLEGNPAFVHGGPFANIAHGCNSVMATRMALKLGDYVVTEAGFGADLGAEKFFDIKCRKAGLTPEAAVIVATVRALKMHGGVAKEALGKEDLTALKRGLANLDRHVENVRKFGVPAVVAINHFATDTEAEHELIRDTAATSSAWRRSSASTGPKARPAPRRWPGTWSSCARRRTAGRPRLRHLYPDELPLWDKMRTIAREIYGAEDIIADQRCATVQGIPSGRLRPLPDLRGQDPVQLLDRPNSRARPPATSSRSASCGSPAAPSSWS